MPYDTHCGVSVTHNDPDAPWPERRKCTPHVETPEMVVHAVETRGCEVLSYRRDTRRSPSNGIIASSSASHRKHRRSKGH